MPIASQSSPATAGNRSKRIDAKPNFDPARVHFTKRGPKGSPDAARELPSFLLGGATALACR
jgi:hypothetical protein